MNIIVCIKQILDPEIPPAKFKVDTVAKKVVCPEGIPLVVSPYDEQAVEAALRIKESRSDAKLTALTLGGAGAKDAIKHVLSMGVDEGIIVNDDAFEGSDAFGTAYILSKAIEKLGDYGLVLCGRQAADWDAGQVGPVLAEYLGIPVVTVAKEVAAVDGKVTVKQVLADGYRVLHMAMPALVTVSSEIGQARLPSGKGIVMAARKQVTVWSSQDLGCDPGRIGSGAARAELAELFVPSQDRKSEIITGKDVAEAAGNLAGVLRREGAI